MALVVACFLCPALLRARYTPFTGDEVYTLRIAEQPTVREMLAVSRRIDLHPPLHYLTERAALALPLPRWLTARLPSLFATVATFLLCFLFVQRAADTLAAFIAAALLWFTPALPFGWLNRPYALWLFFLALLAVCWQRAGAPQASPLWTVAVFLSASGMVLDYMAGTVCVLPFLAVELFPTWPRRAPGIPPKKLHWPLITALIAPCAVGSLYVRQVADFATNTFSPAYLNWAGTTLDIYAELAIPAAVVAACLLTTWLLTRNSASAPLGCSPRADSLTVGKRWLATEDTTSAVDGPASRAALGLLLLPILFAILAAVRHTQFFTRYGGCGALGIAMLAGYLAPRLTRHPHIAAAFVGLALVTASALRTQDAFFDPSGPWRAASIQGVPAPTLAQFDPQQPIVVARAAGFVEMNERETGAILHRTYYLYDRTAAEQFSGSTVFETIATTANLLHFQDHAAPLAPFLDAHRSFYLIANYKHPEEWLPRYLMASGAHLRYLGKFASTYEDDDLYFVTLR